LRVHTPLIRVLTSFFLMFLKINHFIFFFFLVTGTTIAISSNSWFTSWIGLEINLIRIIPLILIKINQPLTERAIKYFITQAIASLILILRVSVNFFSSEEMLLIVEEKIIFFSLLIKAGVPPFHFWFPQIIDQLHWSQCFILFTWQKVAPLIFLRYLDFNLMWLSILIAVSVGSVGGINQTKIKNLITYSSIAHSGWLVSSSLIRLINWLTYFFIYSFITAVIIIIAQIYDLTKINEINFKIDWKIKYLFSFNFITLGGLPPFLGFMAKISILYPLILSKIIIQPSIIIITSLVSLYFYTRIIYRTIIQKEFISITLINKKSTNSLVIILITFIRILISLLTFVD